MEIRIANFDVLTKHYNPFIEGKREIHEVKNKFLAKIDPLRKEMESIIQSAQSGLIVDKNSEQIRMEKFRKLQEEAIAFDNEFKVEFKRMNDELNVKVYDQLESIISEWCQKNGIDLVLGKIEVVFVRPEFEITDTILEVLKEKELFVELPKPSETEKESV